MFRGQRPDINPAQILSGIPIVAGMLAAFHVYTVTPAQLDSLEKFAQWGVGLLFADAIIRVGRNYAAAKNPALMPIDPAVPADVDGGDAITAGALTDDELEQSIALEGDGQDTPVAGDQTGVVQQTPPGPPTPPIPPSDQPVG